MLFTGFLNILEKDYSFLYSCQILRKYLEVVITFKVFSYFLLIRTHYHRKDGVIMSNMNSPNNKDDFSKTNFANLTESSRIEITELEQKLKKESGEKIVLVAYQI